MRVCACVCGVVQDTAAVVERGVSAAVHEGHGKAARLAAYLYHLPCLRHRWQSWQRHLYSLPRRGDLSINQS